MARISTKLRFFLGLLRHPDQIRARMRELSRISAAPSRSKSIPTDSPVDVSVIPIVATDSFGQKLVKIYADNPSPYVSGPTDLKRLAQDLGEGKRFFLVINGEGETVGARAFEPETKRMVGSVTDFHHRGKGYQFSAAAIVRKLLVAEGFREFRGEILRDNTRQIRKMEAQGWELTPHPKKSHIVCCVQYVVDDS